MNVLYIADPNSIHDVRWINFFASKRNVKSYVIFRKWHVQRSDDPQVHFNQNVVVVDSIHDVSAIRPWRNWIQARRIKSIIRKNGIRIMHILYAEPNALWSNWRRRFGIPIVITTRGTDILQTIPAFFRRQSILDKIVAANYRRAFTNADLITCTSQAQVTKLTDLGIKHRNIRVIRTGVNFDSLDQSQKNVSTSLGIVKSFVLMPRNMQPMYYHEFTLDAIALLPPRIRQEYAFVFINAGDKTQNYFKDILRKAATVYAQIRFVSSLTQGRLLGLFMEASLVVMNPRSDGSPVTAMEAMACNAPLILPPLPYDFPIFQNVFTFSNWSPQSLSDKISEVLRTPEKVLAESKRMNYEAVKAHGNMAIELNKVWHEYNELERNFL